MALGEDKQRKLRFLTMRAFVCASLALQHNGFVPSESLDADIT